MLPSFPSRSVILLMIISFLFFYASSYGQQVTQITNGESTFADANYEAPLILSGIGYYTTYLDDRIHIRELDTNAPVYVTSFQLCEKEVIRWIVIDETIIYVTYYSLIVEDILGETSEEYFFREDLNEDLGSTSISANNARGLVRISYTGADQLLFDLTNRHFIDEEILNLRYVTSQFLYHISPTIDRHFIRKNRVTFESDTILSNYSNLGGLSIRNTDNYYLLTEEYPFMMIDSEDNITTFDLVQNENFRNGIETNVGTVIFIETIPGAKVFHTLDRTTGGLLTQDTFNFDRKLIPIDAYDTRIYLETGSQFEEFYGYIDYPYTEIILFDESYSAFSNHHITVNQDLLIINRYTDEYENVTTIVEKATNEFTQTIFNTSDLFLDNELDIVDTEAGVRFLVNESTGRAVYGFDDQNNTINLISRIENKRGLGTSVQKNQDSYLILDDHSLHDRFEYTHPITNELLFHQVEGIIHGTVIPYDGNYFYIRNQNYENQNQDFILDFVMLNPTTGEVTLIEEDFFYPSSMSSFPNINFDNQKFGFKSIYDTNIVFDLRNKITLFSDPTTRILLENIYFESQDYFFSRTSGFNPDHYRISKSDYSDRTLIYQENIEKFLPIDSNSFLAIYADKIYWVDNDQVTFISTDPSYAPDRIAFRNQKLYFTKFDGINGFIKTQDLNTGEMTNTTVEGFPYLIVGDHILSTATFSPPYTITSTNLTSGESYSTLLLDVNIFPFYYTNDKIYQLEREAGVISILNTKLEFIGSIDAAPLKNASWEILSPFNASPVIFQLEKPNIENQYTNLPDYSLLVLDPETDAISEHFGCDDELRFNEAFTLDPISYMLLRTPEEGYQVHRVVLSSLTTATDDLTAESTPKIIISPNPTYGLIQLDQTVQTVTVFNNIGIIMQEYKGVQELNLSRLSAGIYYLKISSENGNTQIQKVVKI